MENSNLFTQRRILVMVGLVIIVTIIFFTIWSRSESVNTSEQQPLQTTSTEEASSTVITNQVGGYSFSIPNGWYTVPGDNISSSEILLPAHKSIDTDNGYAGDIFIDVYLNLENKDFTSFYSGRDINLFNSSAKQTPFKIHRFDAMRFDEVPGMLPSTIVAVKFNGRIIEITDYNMMHQSDSIFDSIVSSLTEIYQ